MFWILALVSYLGISSPFVLSCTRSSRTSLDAADAVKRLAQRDSCRAMDWSNYFPIDFLASRVAQDPHEQYWMSVLEPYASDSRARLFCTQQSCNIFLLHRHWDWIPLSHSVCLCHFLLTLVHKNSDKWVWLSNLLRKSSNFKIVMHFEIVYLISSHLCVIYRQMSIIVLFVCFKKPAALPWSTNEFRHCINHINLTHPQSWQIPSYIPLEVQVNTVGVLYPNTRLLNQKNI